MIQGTFFYRAKGFPGAIPSREWLIERGLFDVLGRGFRAVQCPREGDALLCSRDTTMHEVTAALSELGDDAWQPWDAAGDIRFAWFKDERRPSPDRLLRSSLERIFPWKTKPLVMGDGHCWDIPVLRDGPDTDAVLPLVMRWNASDSKFCPAHSNRHAALADLLRRATEHQLAALGLTSGADTGITMEEQSEIIREALCLIYRVSGPEIGALGLLDSLNIAEALAITINAEAMAEWVVAFCNTAIAAREALE